MQREEADSVCGIIKDLQVFRKFVIKMEVRIVNTTTALAARMCGYNANDEASREKLWSRAQRIVRRELAGKEHDGEDVRVVAAIKSELVMAKLALEPILKRRAEIEAEMVEKAKALPLERFVSATAGFSWIALAVIVGEAGNLANYSTIRKLWRRLGYGMASGHESQAYSTWRKMGGLSAKDWEQAGYSPQRLGQIYGVVTVPLMMHKKKNKYGAVYDARRAQTFITHPEWYVDKDGNQKLNKDGEPRSAHAKMDAERIATKALLADLRTEWCRSVIALAEESKTRMADATLPPIRRYPEGGYEPLYPV